MHTAPSGLLSLLRTGLSPTGSPIRKCLGLEDEKGLSSVMDKGGGQHREYLRVPRGLLWSWQPYSSTLLALFAGGANSQGKEASAPGPATFPETRFPSSFNFLGSYSDLKRQRQDGFLRKSLPVSLFGQFCSRLAWA